MTLTLCGERVTLGRLRREMPAWTWRAEQAGFGTYRYLGSLGERRVTVRSHAELCGDSDDDFAIRWMVDDGTTATSYAAWAAAQEGDDD